MVFDVEISRSDHEVGIALGLGFPGWHIECSAMASRYLGDRIDIHCGGIDHINVHHSNEVAQSECCFGHRWVNYWFHCEFLNVDAEKMSKSKGEFLTVDTLIDKGYDPLAFRLLVLGSHYRSALTFSWDALDAASTALRKARLRIAQIQGDNVQPQASFSPEYVAAKTRFSARWIRICIRQGRLPSCGGCSRLMCWMTPNASIYCVVLTAYSAWACLTRYRLN